MDLLGCIKDLVNPKLLPLKTVYFFVLAAVASLLPYLAVFMKQVGLSPSEVAIIYGTMPFVGAFVRSIVGAVADKFNAHRASLMICCILTGLFYNLLMIVPHGIARGWVFSDITLHDLELQCDANGIFIKRCGSGQLPCWMTRDKNASRLFKNCSITCDMSECMQRNLSSFDETCIIPNEPNIAKESSESHTFPVSIETSDLEYKSNDTECFSVETKILYSANTVHQRRCTRKMSFNCTSFCRSLSPCDINVDGDGSAGYKFSRTFWVFFVINLLANISFAPIFGLVDALTYNHLGTGRGRWGWQRLWGTVGFAMFGVICGLAMDLFSDDHDGSGKKNYTISFIMMGVCMMMGAIGACFYHVSGQIICAQLLKNIRQVLAQIQVLCLLFVVFMFGTYTGLIETFLYWHLQTLGAPQVLLGLCMLMNCIPEVPILFFAGSIVDKIGHVASLYIVMVAYAIRMGGYAFLTKPWLVLLLEPLHGITFGLMYATASSYGSLITPSGMHGTIQGLIGALHFGLGKGAGSVFGGVLFETYGAKKTFGSYALSSLVLLVFYVLVQLVVKCYKRTPSSDVTKPTVKENVVNEDELAPVNRDNENDEEKPVDQEPSEMEAMVRDDVVA